MICSFSKENLLQYISVELNKFTFIFGEIIMTLRAISGFGDILI